MNFSLIYYRSMEESLRPYCGCSTIELRLEFVERHAFRQIRNVWKADPRDGHVSAAHLYVSLAYERAFISLFSKATVNI